MKEKINKTNAARLLDKAGIRYELIPYEAKLAVACSSEDKGPKVMKVCEVGCIGCKLCEKQCQFDAIHVLDNVAHIDQEKCTGCGACAAKCPKKIITMVG